TYSFVEKLWATRRVGEIIDEIDLHGNNKELTDELVALSTKHGILTPYTSFLADDGVGIRNLADNRRQAGLALEALKEEAGQAGVAQRDSKAKMLRAMAPAKGGAATFRKADEDREVTVRTVQNVGSKAFFQRGGRWIDSSLTEEQEKKAQKVERFGKE